MLTKFESKSNRVKGLSFHPVRPWILASLHNGVIQLWDYRMGTLLDRFEEHDGPVRGVDFHKTQPLIVSGGDDYKVKVWDYKLRRCLFTLLGHLDYIRTVQFHNEYPWIVSASDDQVIRIWNWQSRACISVLTGHNHYVMCAGFHPKEDLIISASLDQTIRVWDTAGLRKKTVRGLPAMDDGSVANRINNDLFGGNDAVVKYVLEGHDRGVNWASFHPTLPLIVSGADDRQVKLWRMNETKAWEVDTMRGHTNNVSCVLFHPKHELILSNSEDRTIRVWDISKRLSVQTFRRESDRFWILASHPEQNLLAAGHDSGMLVFKLERERPPYDVHGSRMFYVKDRYLRLHEFGSARDVPIHSLRRTTGAATTGLGGGPRQLQYNSFNPGEHNLLITSDSDGGSYELLTFACEGGPGSGPTGEPTDSRRGSAMSVAFIGRNRFAVLDKTRQLLVKNMENEVVKKVTPPVASVDQIYFGGVSGRLLLRSEDKIILFDQAARKVIAELQVPRVKYVVWSPDCSYVALLAKHQVVLATKHLEQLSTSAETVRVKSGSWCMHKPIFVYSTLNHVKYLLSNGDKGIVRGLEAPVYITKATDQQLGCLDREGKTRTLSIDLTEALFKLALEEKNYPEVMRMVKHSRLCGEAIVSFLQEKGYPEVALHFVQDKHTRFRLALACGNIEIAMNVAYEIGDDKCWRQLAAEALRQGNHEVVEMAYQKTKQFERLSFLYLLTGNSDKLRKMLKIAEMRNDVMSRFHNALFLGDAEERVRVLEYTGQYSLAYLTASVHGLEEIAEGLKEKLVAGGLDLPELPTNATLLQPPTPIMRADNWPLLSVGKSVLAGIAAGEYEAPVSKVDEDVFHDASAHDAWGGDDLSLDDDVAAATESKGEGGGWDDDDLELDDDEFETHEKQDNRGARSGDRMPDGSIFVTPNPGTPATSYWIDNSSHAADHAAAGSLETAMTLLNRQIAAVQFAPMKTNMVTTFMGAYGYIPGLPLTPSRRVPLQRNAATGNPGKDSLPMTTVKLQPLLEDLKQAYRAFTQGAFGESQALFTRIIQTIPLVLTDSRSEGNELKELLEVSREYITAIRLKSAMAETNDPVRTMELSAYFTHCNLQPAHLVLALKLAMSSAFKFKNYITAASFARRLLELPDVNSERNADLRSKSAKVLQKSEKEGRNEHQLHYDERNPFVIDCFYLGPIYRGTESIRCAYCSSSYATDVRGRVCETCGIAQIGVETVGLVTSAAATGRN